jgi:hypothetical protein
MLVREIISISKDNCFLNISKRLQRPLDLVIVLKCDIRRYFLAFHKNTDDRGMTTVTIS